MRILIAEDDKSIADAVKKRLLAERYSVDACDNGLDAYDYITMTDYDVIIMDIMMPGEDGLSVVRRARAEGVEAPVLFLTARDAVADRVAGLDAGGDDYLVKPFALDELMARIRVLSRRSGSKPRATNELTLGDLSMDTAAQRVTRAALFHSRAANLPSCNTCSAIRAWCSRATRSSRTSSAMNMKALPIWWMSIFATFAKNWTRALNRN